MDLLIRENILDEDKLKLFIEKYGEERLSIVNLLKVRLLHQEKMDEVLLRELRLQSISMSDLEGLQVAARRGCGGRPQRPALHRRGARPGQRGAWDSTPRTDRYQSANQGGKDRRAD